jgi:uncharacterized protein YndB with AHSA1/START domain
VIVLDEEVSIGRPREAVFDYLADLRHYPEWQPAVKRAELVGGGQPKTGSRIRLLVAGPGKDVDVDGEITQLERPERLGLRSLTGPAKLQAAVVFERANEGAGGTLLRIHAELQPTGLLRFAEGVIRDRIRQELPAMLSDLRDRVEREVPAAPGVAASASRGARPPKAT